MREATEWDGEDKSVVDVDEWPRDADDGETARRDHVGVDEPTLQVVAQDRRHDVGHELGQTEQRQSQRTLLQRDSFTLHVIALHIRQPISVSQTGAVFFIWSHAKSGFFLEKGSLQ